jgi:hypothetical protein
MPNDALPTTPSPVTTDNDSGMTALGELICRLNPYTELPFDKTSNMQTGKMEVGTLPKPTGNYTTNSAQTDTIACIEIEVERNYAAQWTFKGQTQTVKAAFRIPYRFQVRDKSGNVLYWQTEYLLVGYAGSDGGG